MQKLKSGKKLFSAILSISILLGAVLSVPGLTASAFTVSEDFDPADNKYYSISNDDVANFSNDNLLRATYEKGCETNDAGTPLIGNYYQIYKLWDNSTKTNTGA
ncbi:MAG: hypothetical protein ACI4F7_01645, partial [Acutalibacteraceae bacterium]